jgi:alkyl hydroperoxide reductase subunit AhpC
MAYGCFDEATGAAMRYSFILDAAGIVRGIVRSDQLTIGRQHEEYAKALLEM